MKNNGKDEKALNTLQPVAEEQEPTGAIDTADTVDAPQEIEAADAVNASETIDAANAVNASETIEADADAPETIEAAADASEAIDAADTMEASDTKESAGQKATETSDSDDIRGCGLLMEPISKIITAVICYNCHFPYHNEIGNFCVVVAIISAFLFWR